MSILDKPKVSSQKDKQNCYRPVGFVVSVLPSVRRGKKLQFLGRPTDSSSVGIFEFISTSADRATVNYRF